MDEAKTRRLAWQLNWRATLAAEVHRAVEAAGYNAVQYTPMPHSDHSVP